jgi:hypothetical protein
MFIGQGKKIIKIFNFFTRQGIYIRRTDTNRMTFGVFGNSVRANSADFQGKFNVDKRMELCDFCINRSKGNMNRMRRVDNRESRKRAISGLDKDLWLFLYI